MHSLSDLLKKRLNQHKLGASAGAAELVFRAQQLLAQQLPGSQDSVRPVCLKQSVLWIEVEGSAWAQEVWGVTPQLLSDLQSEFGAAMVKSVRTKQLTSP